MSQISTISEFLLHAGTDYRIFDMGRGIRKIGSQRLLDIENGKTPAPYPRQQHLWCGIVFWNRQLSAQHYIWFIKLPLDEQGLLVAAARNQFLQTIVDALGNQLEHTETKNGQLPENPYTFVPSQQLLADFNSISRKTLKLGQSEHFANAAAYIAAPDQHDWQQVPLQGIADYVAALDQPQLQQQLIDNMARLAPAVQQALLVSMENHEISVTLSEAIIGWMANENAEPQGKVLALRAMAQSTAPGLVKQAVSIAMQAADADILTVIAARHWQQLQDEAFLRQYLDRLAQTEPDTLFAALFSDLVQIPQVRLQLLASLRWTDKSEVLTAAVGRLFSGQGQQA